MMRARERLARVLLVALCLTAPAFAATSPSLDDPTDPGLENRATDAPRYPMPPPDAAAKPAAATTQAAPGVSANPLWAVPLSALAATRNRPLFSPLRRQPAPAVANAPIAALQPTSSLVVPEHPNLLLVGTVAGGADGIAVFIESTTHGTVRLHTGEGHDGWVLQAIDGRAATLQKNGLTETLELPRSGPTQGPAPIVNALPPSPPPTPQ